jgi:pimeloyl-ACP methyl ester carboxylesterase
MVADPSTDESAEAPRSSRFAVDGHHLFLRTMGHVPPTVVLESGLGRTSDDWLDSGIMEQIATFAQVCAYDRAGLGQSEQLHTPTPRTAQDLADDLAALLQSAQLPPPYILAGHSFGGFIARAFAYNHPTETAGLILIDAMHEDDTPTVLSLLPPAAPDELPSLTDYRAAFLETASLEPEPIDWAASSLQMRQAGLLGACPLVVITAERFDLAPDDFPEDLVSQLAQTHQTLQQSLTTLSSRSAQMIAHGSGHIVMRDHPACIVQAVREIVDAVRSVKKGG